MKRLFCLFIFLLFFSWTSASEVVLASHWNAGGITPRGQEIISDQIMPIVETFGFGLSAGDFLGDGEQGNNGLSINLNEVIPQQTQADYSIIRGGVELNTRQGSLEVGDIIRLTPTEVAIGNDWVSPGGTNTDPPIEPLGLNEFCLLSNTLLAKFIAKYPCGQQSKCDTRGELSEIPLFQTETVNFDSTTQSYIGEEDKEFFVVPGARGTKLGVLVASSHSLLNSQGPFYNCIEANNGIDCTLKETGSQFILPIANYRSVLFVDKIFLKKKALEADWFSWNSTISNMPPLELQIVPKDKEVPVADFECKINQGNRLDCDASASFDPDGTIRNWSWNNVISSHKWKTYGKPISTLNKPCR